MAYKHTSPMEENNVLCCNKHLMYTFISNIAKITSFLGVSLKIKLQEIRKFLDDGYIRMSKVTQSAKK